LKFRSAGGGGYRDGRRRGDRVRDVTLHEHESDFCDIGGHHIGFLVDDMDAAVAYLKSKGVQVQGEPTKMTQGPTAGETWVYFLAPWGTQLELTYYPKGLAYEKSVTGQVLWNPAKPDK
jgi:catechol 2,3-dioxygenase-like lactoylglutathione lyase family enzyme